MKDTKGRNVLHWAISVTGGIEMELTIHTTLPIALEEAADLSRALELATGLIRKETTRETAPEA